jgi:hypothetical protein
MKSFTESSSSGIMSQHDWGKKITGGYFSESDHHYRDDGGTPVIACTRVFDILGMVDLDNIARQVLMWKRAYGSALHRCVQYLAHQDLDWGSVDERLVEPLKGIEKFLKDCEFEVVYAEEPRISSINGMKFGMTPDLVGKITYQGKKRNAVIDVKTGAAYSPTWAWQVGGGYLSEATGDWVAGILKVDPAGKVTPYWIGNAEIANAKREFAILLAAALLKVNAGMATLTK